MRTHSGERPNKCNQCDYASFQKKHLKVHIKTHNSKKSNRCNRCDYASFQASNLRRHSRIHTGVKSNICNQCGNAFSCAQALIKHLKKDLSCNKKTVNAEGADQHFEIEFPISAGADIVASPETAVDVKIEPLEFVAVNLVKTELEVADVDITNPPVDQWTNGRRN